MSLYANEPVLTSMRLKMNGKFSILNVSDCDDVNILLMFLFTLRCNNDNVVKASTRDLKILVMAGPEYKIIKIQVSLFK